MDKKHLDSKEQRELEHHAAEVKDWIIELGIDPALHTFQDWAGVMKAFGHGLKVNELNLYVDKDGNKIDPEIIKKKLEEQQNQKLF